MLDATQATLLLDKKIFDEAEELLCRAISLDPDAPNPFHWLAQLYRRRAGEGDAERERAAWEKFLKLGGTTEARIEGARERLAALGQSARFGDSGS